MKMKEKKYAYIDATIPVNTYERKYEIYINARTDNDVSGLSPIYIPAAG